MVKPPNTKRPPDDKNHPSPTSNLGDRIARLQAERAAEAQPRAGAGDNYNASAVARGFRLASEFVAAIIVGAGLGYGADLLFGTSPWGLIILLLLGFAAGVLNVIRATAEMTAAAPKQPNVPSVTDDDDDD
jgi:ATP synthase protein I